MKTIIAGSRSIDSYYQVSTAIKESGFDVTTIVSGTASGVDSTGEDYALENNIQVERYPANWKEHGKSAGYLRNVEINYPYLQVGACSLGYRVPRTSRYERLA